jgi:DHA3 family tetracycline resistance protein-like MFS transporter
MDPLQLVLTGTTLEVTVLIFEIPTGVLADVYSRRLSTILGVALIGGSLIIEGSFPLFAIVLLSQVIWGIGWTLISGAHDAWIADEIGADAAAGTTALPEAQTQFPRRALMLPGQFARFLREMGHNSDMG